MIPILLRDLLRRLWLVALIGLLLYLREPSFHQHGPVDPANAVELGPRGLAASLSYLAAAASVILLAGFVSRDRERGFYQMILSHPTRPLALYGLRWMLAVALAIATAATFLVVGQLIAWGELRGGATGLLLALLSALVFGGLMAFFSVTLTRGGDAWVVGFLLLLTYAWPWVTFVLQGLSAPVRQALLFLLPPQGALQEVYAGLLDGRIAWGGATFAAGYGIFWLLAAAVLLRVREWP